MEQVAEVARYEAIEACIEEMAALRRDRANLESVIRVHLGPLFESDDPAWLVGRAGSEIRELRAAVQALTARVRTDLEALEMEREK
jgi:predicted DNA-binding ribbon-helix-helix protein